ncbi:hypothetical protein KW800_01355 [Candidatus Parcubacteria bacterium]|nr:hypothetical protein [Candidatus Parcubacteria bacterium]
MAETIIPGNIRRRVRYGAKQLDRFQPGWVGRVDVDKLDVSDRERCVAGQLVGDFSRNYDQLDISNNPIATGMFVEGPLDSPVVRSEYRLLTEAWKREIAVRRARMSHVPRFFSRLFGRMWNTLLPA